RKVLPSKRQSRPRAARSANQSGSNGHLKTALRFRVTSNPWMNDAARSDATSGGHRTASHAVHAYGHGHHAPKTRKALALLSLGALGVVYGDIGTSPLYAMKESLSTEHNVAHGVRFTDQGIELVTRARDAADVLGILSLVLWSLILVVCIKYLVFVLRADNK